VRCGQPELPRSAILSNVLTEASSCLSPFRH
jgi:hypothetical protein